MRSKFVTLTLAFLLGSTLPAGALPNVGESNSIFARATATASGWLIDYPDFSQALLDKKWNFILKAVNGNTLDSDDSAEFTLRDGKGKELLSDVGYSSGSNGFIEFYDYIRGSDFAGVDLTQPFTATIKISRGYGSALKDATITVVIPVTTFPKRPTSAREYLSLATTFKSIPYPQNCTAIEFQFSVNDPYNEVSTVEFAVNDSSGKQISSTTSFGTSSGMQKDDIQLCPSALAGSSAPFAFTTKIIFESSTGKLALKDKIAFPLTSKVDEAVARSKSLGDYCVKGSVSKVVTAGLTCPSGFRKVIFVPPSEVAWNSLIRMPSTQKGKNYIVYACVAQFDANTGGSRFRAYASPVQVQYYFSDGMNAIFTGVAKQLLTLGEKSAFIAKVNVSGGVSYNSMGGEIIVPSLAIRQLQKIGRC